MSSEPLRNTLNLSAASSFSIPSLREKITRTLYSGAVAIYKDRISDIAHCVQEGMTLPKAVEIIFRLHNSHLQIIADERTKEIITNGSGLIVANHPTNGDGFTLWRTMRERNKDDVYIIGQAENIVIYPFEINEHYIAVFLPGNNSLQKGIAGIKKQMVLKREDLIVSDDRQRKERNKEHLLKASRIIQQGGIVGIFPSGGGNEQATWRDGAARIIKGVNTDTDHHFVFAYIKGTSKYDKLRLLLACPYKIKVYLHSIPFSEIPLTETDKWLTDYLQTEYIKWVESVRHSSQTRRRIS